MVQQPQIGSVIKMYSWHGIVLDVFTGATGKTVLYVQTARNIFRGKNPEHIEVDLAPDAVSQATLEDLEREIADLKRRQDGEIAKLLRMALDTTGNRDTSSAADRVPIGQQSN
ncbi:MAG: hypothetical protein U0350_48225 [Caldilineaceae bacterium]